MKNSVCKGGHPVEQRERENILQGRFTEILPDSLAPKAAWLLRKTEVLTAAKLLAPARCHSCYRNSWEPPKLALLILGFSSSLSHASWWFLHATPFSAIELATACARTFGAGRAEPYRKAKTGAFFACPLTLSGCHAQTALQTCPRPSVDVRLLMRLLISLRGSRGSPQFGHQFWTSSSSAAHMQRGIKQHDSDVQCRTPTPDVSCILTTNAMGQISRFQ